ncbi:MAG: SpoIID/LytB domain-containing protein [Roseburia sp.]
MKVKGKYIRKIIWMLLAAGTITTILLMGRCSVQKESADRYVWREEIPDWLTFTGFTQEDIADRIGNAGRVSAKDAEELIEMLHLSDQIECTPKGRFLTRSEWTALYRQFLDYYDATQVEEKTIVLLNTDEDTLNAVEGTFNYGTIPFSLEPYYAYTVFCEDGRVLGVGEKKDGEIVLENEYIVECGEGTLTFLCDNTKYQVPMESEETISDVVADLVFADGKITRIRKKEEQIQGKLLALTDTYAEIKGYGQVPCSDTMKFYSTYQGIRESRKEDLLLENMEITYVVAEGEICAFLMQQPANMENIRVLLLNGESPYYTDIYVSSDGAVKIVSTDSEKQAEAGTVIAASDYQDCLHDSALFLSPADGTSPLYLTDSSGTKISYGYQGTLEVRHYSEGYSVVNVVDLETYLKGVIASEMPASYELEALKCQAICARSYAYRQLLENNYQGLGAHVDDSTNYQVYNKKDASAVTDQAVDETAGQVLCMGDQVIEAFYYSTSYGHSGDYTAWDLNGEEYPYLSGYWIRSTDAAVDLSDEEAFASYICQPDPECYESDIKFFRWSANLDFSKKKEELYARIQARKSLQPDFIHYYKKSDGRETESMDDFGQLVGISVEERNSSGVIGCLKLSFENGTVSVDSEYNMRYILGSGLGQIRWQDDSATDAVTLLPSAYFTVSENGSGSYTLYGGGYGHGLGMSQNGAQKLALNGWVAEDILQKFYPGTTISDLYCLDDGFVVE